ncbi:type II 3-dehydroquinate dehydratase [Bdellovibrionota bacterium]
MKNCLILHGPNLNLLGDREPALYGRHTLSDINEMLISEGERLQVTVATKQSNFEGELVSWIQEAEGKHDGIVINAGGYTHSSVAIRDALIATNIPFVEVHMTNLAQRESFRQKSLLSDIAVGSIMGFGWRSYIHGLQSLIDFLNEREHAPNN